MIKCDKEYKRYFVFKYYNNEGKHELLNEISNEKAASIINDLMLCENFKYDQTILDALYMAMRKLQGFSDEDIQRLIR